MTGIFIFFIILFGPVKRKLYPTSLHRPPPALFFDLTGDRQIKKKELRLSGAGHRRKNFYVAFIMQLNAIIKCLRKMLSSFSYFFPLIMLQ